MSLKIFVAGASGVIGRRLVPLLLERGYDVVGTTRSTERAGELERAGAHPVVVDVFDRAALERAIADARPEVVIHQLTDLAGGFALDHISETLGRNARVRTKGTRNLVDAALSGGVRRLVAQSIAWVYQPGPEPHREDDPLDYEAEGDRAVTVQGVMALEEAVLGATPMEGIVLRYGWLYGPGASARPAGTPGLHVDAAASAAVQAIARGAAGVYNVAELSPALDVAKARKELGWDPAFRQALPADAAPRSRSSG
jgi:nucleoside-diphosphate-sugar epimerase